MARVKPRADDDEIMVAITSGVAVAPDGEEHTVTFGMRLRRDRPAVRLAPSWFVAASCDDLELAEAARRLIEDAQARGAALQGWGVPR